MPAANWRVTPVDEELSRELQDRNGCSSVVAHLLTLRGIEDAGTAERFLNPSYDHMADPMLLPDAEPAVQRLSQAIEQGERVFIHGDYDGDGVTSAALWMRLLQKMGADALVHVPHRHREGYDMRSAFIERAKEAQAKVILTTDCGVQRADEVELARAAGIDVVITDHHEPPERLPKAVAVVNPHRADNNYPFPNLAGVGVAFRLGEALVRSMGKPVDSYRKAFSDLAAIGTVTDVMPLMEDNRVIVKHGLAALSETNKPGLQALMREAKVDPARVSSSRIGFQLGPRLNAIGRVDDSKHALDLLLAREAGDAVRLASQLERANADRRIAQAKVLAEAMQQADKVDLTQSRCMVIHGEGWHAGVLGLVANKLVEQFHRPALVISVDPATGMGRGSARSIRGFDLYGAVEACGDLLEEFGGHQYAAGFSIRGDQVEAFRESMLEIGQELITDEDLVPVIDVDMELSVDTVTTSFLDELAILEPCGRGNERPMFVSRQVRVGMARRIGQEGKHLKLGLHTAGELLDGIWWGMGDWADRLGGKLIDLCYHVEGNEFNGRVRPQALIQDIRLSGGD